MSKDLNIALSSNHSFHHIWKQAMAQCEHFLGYDYQQVNKLSDSGDFLFALRQTGLYSGQMTPILINWLEPCLGRLQKTPRWWTQSCIKIHFRHTSSGISWIFWLRWSPTTLVANEIWQSVIVVRPLPAIELRRIARTDSRSSEYLPGLRLDFQGELRPWGDINTSICFHDRLPFRGYWQLETTYS